LEVTMDQSKFNLWRACFSFCFVDGFLDEKELSWITDKLKTLPFTSDQVEILQKDLSNPPDIDTLLPFITRPADRGFLVNHLRILSKIDNDLSELEKHSISKIYDQIMKKIDITNLNNLIAEDERASYHEDEVYKVDNKH